MMLPLELIHEVGFFLSPAELCPLSLTCRAYRDALTSLLFKNIQVDDEHLGKAAELPDVVRSAVRHVTLRHLEGVSQTDTNVYGDLGLFPYLKSLDVTICDKEESYYPHTISYGLSGFTNVLEDLRQLVECLSESSFPLEDFTFYLDSHHLSSAHLQPVSFKDLPAFPPLKTFRAHIDVFELLADIPYAEFLLRVLGQSSLSLTSLYWDNFIDLEETNGLKSLVDAIPNIMDLTFGKSALYIRHKEELTILFAQFSPLRNLKTLRLSCLTDIPGGPAILMDLLPSRVETLSRSCHRLEDCFWDTQFTPGLSFRFELIPHGITRIVHTTKCDWEKDFFRNTFSRSV
ncbi:hypothetical protein ONZ45_g16833 [Pleurotus djamor]|nr:hypothetical protein ONZ45_g16833 [Pleurotus djamor]